MTKLVGVLCGALLMVPGAAFAAYLPVYGMDGVVFGIGGQNPYAGNCNYEDDCRFPQYNYYPQQPYSPSRQTYWCNGYYSYTPCRNAYGYDTAYTGYQQYAPNPLYFYGYAQPTNYAYMQPTYMQYSPYTYSSYSGYYPVTYTYSW
jgi:hypothetical protein